MLRFFRDRRGSMLIEVALILPLLPLFAAGYCVMWQNNELARNLRFVAQAGLQGCVSNSANLTPAQLITNGQAAFANAAAMYASQGITFQSVVTFETSASGFKGASVPICHISATATEPAWWPLFGDTLTSTLELVG